MTIFLLFLLFLLLHTFGWEFIPFFFVLKQNKLYINCTIEILNVTINGSPFSKINKNSFDLIKNIIF